LRLEDNGGIEKSGAAPERFFVRVRYLFSPVSSSTTGAGLTWRRLAGPETAGELVFPGVGDAARSCELNLNV
jgi:hypothetical protein